MIVPPRRPPRNKKLFELHETKRIPVEVTPTARQYIDSSSHQGRLFPQALSEFFALESHVERVQVDAVPKSSIHPVGPEETHPIYGGEPVLLKITVHSLRGDIPEHVYYINEEHLEEIPDSGLFAFQAHLAASELLRLYPHRRETR